jgi:N-acetylglucosaminyl-diphospho-decaprenol L-rhamnosyltransferase
MTSLGARVTAVMVTYNSGHVVSGALEHLPDKDEAHLVVVDNLSTDDSIEVVEGLRPDALIIRNINNDGFAKAVNLGAARADTDYILLLNPDAYIEGQDLKRLVEDMDSDRAVAISAPLMTDPHGQYSTIAAGHSPTIWRMALHESGLSRLGKYFSALEGHYLFKGSRLDSIREIDWVSGGCMLIRRSAWESMGGLSTKWFMYAEDVEFCLRARQAGLKVIMDPNSLAVHDFGGSSKDVSGKANPTWVLNLYDLYCSSIAKNPLQRRAWKLIVAGGFAGRSITYRLLRRLRPTRAEEYDAQIHRYAIFRKALLAA